MSVRNIATLIYARALRTSAIFVAVASAVWEFIGARPPAQVAPSLLALRAGTVVAALIIAGLSTPARAERTLQGLAYVLTAVILAANCITVVLDPTLPFETAAVVAVTVLGAALFLPWTARAQAALAVPAALAYPATVLLLTPPGAVAPAALARATLVAAVAAVASILGTQLADRGRRRVHASQARYRGLFAAAGDGIAVLDPSGVIREANARLADLLGLPPERVVGRPLWDFDANKDTTGEHAAALAGKLRLVSHTLTRADGGRVEVEIAFTRTEGLDGPIVQAIVRDVTDRRARDQRRLQEQRLDALSRFAGGIAHQFNNLLGGILTHASLLRREASLGPAAAELEEIAAAARRGRDLTEELLRFTRSDPVQLRPTDAGQVLASVAALARALLPEDVVIEIRVAPALPPLAGDMDHLVHACTQAVLNARDAMRGRPGPKLTLAATECTIAARDPRWPDVAPGRYVQLSVTDTGRGMDPATMERAFEPFFTTKPMHEAPGLGLATLHRVMRDHGGAVRIESEAGRGTTVHLLLAMSSAPLPAAAPAPAAAPVAGATILVVDDEPIIRNSLRRALTHFGHRVLEAGDGGSAVAAMRAANPPVDLVILDLVLPGGGAGIFELLKALRPGVRVLISSGFSPDGEAARGLATRVEGFLPKPYELSQLQTAVAHALAGPPAG